MTAGHQATGGRRLFSEKYGRISIPSAHAHLGVTAVERDQVTIDQNHPLAGVPLNFDVEIMEIRDASDEEKAHGHPHGPGVIEATGKDCSR